MPIRVGGGLRQSIGIETKDGKFARLLTRGSPLPASRTEIFTTGDDGQAAIQITLLASNNRPRRA